MLELPSRVPAQSSLTIALLILTSCVQSTTNGFDGSMMNALNILPSYTDYFTLTTATLALNSASIWVGLVISGIAFAKLPDQLGRKWTLFIGAIFVMIGVILQSAAQNIGMFIAARIIIGFGTGASMLAAPLYLAETLPVKYRAWGLGILYDFYYVGGLISAGVTYGTAQIESTWAWRIPSILQGLFSIICIAILPFVPESPRWLQSKGRSEDALVALAATYSNGDTSDPTVLRHWEEIKEVLTFELNYEKPNFVKQFSESASTRKRIFLAITVAVFSMLSGNNIVSYYFGSMLDQAGITDTTTQLEINVILNAWCLVTSVVGTYYADRIGRKWLAASSTIGCTVFLFLVGGLTKVYGDSTSTSGIYGTVATIFLFQGAYSFGWTPLTVLYPPEVLNYNIRSVGMGIYTFFANGVGLMVTFAFPFALDAIGWKTYMINSAWNVVQIVVILVFWVETAGRTLEEIDANLDGRTGSSDLPDAPGILVGTKPAEIRETTVSKSDLKDDGSA
ncbi:hexose transporter [Xylariales sp. PMI_506]|nr:hexose transporter [Xylariales sp. PMI_506]